MTDMENHPYPYRTQETIDFVEALFSNEARLRWWLDLAAIGDACLLEHLRLLSGFLSPRIDISQAFEQIKLEHSRRTLWHQRTEK